MNGTLGMGKESLAGLVSLAKICVTDQKDSAMLRLCPCSVCLTALLQDVILRGELSFSE